MLSFLIILLEYLIFSVHANIIYIRIHISFASLRCKIHILFVLLTGHDLEFPPNTQVLRMSVRIPQRTIHNF